MKYEILVSICCITYNHENYIRQTLEGFLMQKTEFPFEVIIHDDASTDHTADIIREYETKYPDIIKPIYQIENKYSKGVRIPQKYLYPKTQGKYIALCEGDDYWINEDKLQRQVQYLEEHEECSCVFHAANYMLDGKILRNDRHFDKECDIPIDTLIIGTGAYCATASLCFRKECIKKEPKFRMIAQVGDYPLQLLLGSKGRVHYLPQIMSVYRMGHAGSWTEKMKADRGANILRWRNEIEWLEEFNKETHYQYQSSVYYRIVEILFILYVMKENDFKSIKPYLNKIKNRRQKAELFIKGWKYSFKRYFPNVYTRLQMIKSSIS